VKTKIPDPTMTEVSLIIEGVPLDAVDGLGLAVEADGSRTMGTILQGQRDRCKDTLSQVSTIDLIV
jgi:hypothetical protein